MSNAGSQPRSTKLRIRIPEVSLNRSLSQNRTGHPLMRTVYLSFAVNGSSRFKINDTINTILDNTNLCSSSMRHSMCFFCMMSSSSRCRNSFSQSLYQRRSQSQISGLSEKTDKNKEKTIKVLAFGWITYWNESYFNPTESTGTRRNPGRVAWNTVYFNGH